jgi:hypothetical protein
MQKASNAAFLCESENFLRPLEIDGVEFRVIALPHAGMAGQVVNLVDAGQCLLHEAIIEHRALNVFDGRGGTGRQTHVEHAYLAAVSEEFRDQVLADEAAAASDKSTYHE